MGFWEEVGNVVSGQNTPAIIDRMYGAGTGNGGNQNLIPLRSGYHTIPTADFKKYVEDNRSLFPGVDTENIAQMMQLRASLMIPKDFVQGSDRDSAHPLTATTINVPDAPVAQAPVREAPTPPPVDTQALSDAYAAKVNGIYDQMIPNVTDRIQRATAPGRSKLLSEEASLGRLTSPVSIPGIAKYDENTNNSISDAIGNILGQKATGALDLEKTIAGIKQDTAKATEQSRQFGLDLGLRRDTLNSEINQKNQENDIALKLGQMYANAKKPTSAEDFKNYAGPLSDILGAGIKAGWFA